MTTTTTRHGVFETNSSSTHSITIDHSTQLFTSITPDANGVITLEGGQFGWEWERYADALTKANYCAVHALGSMALNEQLARVICAHTGAVSVVVVADGSDIDHQSEGTAGEAFASDQTLKEFIFGQNSWLYTGNDNSSAPPNFFDHDLTGFTHRVSLEGSSTSFLINHSDCHNREKMEEVIRNLFQNNSYNKFSDDGLADYETGYGISHSRGEDQPPWLNLQDKTVRIVRETPMYGDAGEFTHYRLDAEKLLRFTIRQA